MNSVLSFEDPLAEEHSLSGGKGASLARLTRGGFAVPPGVILAATAYRDAIARDRNATSLLHRLETEKGETGTLKELQRRILELELPPAVERELDAAVGPLLGRGAVAVRSSGTMEDLAGAAFAGQHDTILGVGTRPGVSEAIRRCWASLWEERAFIYRREHGLDQAGASMAVVIQSMVASDVAGVAFTIDPISGEIDSVVINSSWGLGETVVSGETEVDQFTLSKASGAITSRHVAPKSTMIVQSSSGTEHLAVPSHLQHAPSLTDEQLEMLRGLAVRTERYYGFPQDLEWAFEGGELFLLQARPVTRFPERWTRDESAERFPNVVTPLTWDFVQEGFHASLAHSLELMALPAFEGKWFQRYDDYVYGNQTAVRLFTAGQQVAFDSLQELSALLPRIAARYAWVVQLPVSWARDLDSYLLTLGSFSTIDLGALDDAALWNHVERVNRLGATYFLPNIAISITQGILHRMLYRFVSILSSEPARLYDSLTCFCETKTNVVNRDLHELRRIALEHPPLSRLLVEVDRREILQRSLLEPHPRFARRFEKFLADHGHRETDFDAYHPTWSGQPSVVLENLRLLLMQSEITDPSVREAELRRRQNGADGELSRLVPEELRFFAAELVRLARTYTALDDLEHYETTRLSVPFRAALVESGRRLVGRGVLDDPEDVFFLRRETVTALMTTGGDADAARREAESSRSAYLTHRDSAPSWVWGEVDSAAEGSEGMRGLPGSPGVARGKVFVVRSVEDFPHFPSGAVLVARTTNPAWTPLFYSAVAVITESGGPLSHGAVTAREIGIPAVMSLRGAMELFDGDEEVEVNGTAGVVVRL